MIRCKYYKMETRQGNHMDGIVLRATRGRTRATLYPPMIFSMVVYAVLWNWILAVSEEEAGLDLAGTYTV